MGFELEEEIMEAPLIAKPIGEAIKYSGRGRSKTPCFQAFEFDDYIYNLEDSVLLAPEEHGLKPNVVIIKEISQGRDESVMVLVQWLYRPEEAEKRGGGGWEAYDNRELFYSFRHESVPAESVMHKCQVHFVPLHKQVPDRSEHPGFIVQMVYDTGDKKLRKLTDDIYDDNEQHNIDFLVQRTRLHLGELVDILEPVDVYQEREETS